MSSDGGARFLDAQQIVYLPRWARWMVMGVLGLLAICAGVAGIGFFFISDQLDAVAPLLAIAQTAAGAFAVVLFVLFAERQLSTDRLHARTDQFLEHHMRDALAKIEIPQVKRGHTVQVNVLKRADTIHGGRKDIYGANYQLFLENFRMRMWVGINVRRIGVIYFVKAESEADAERFRNIFRFTFGGAEKLGYAVNFEYAEIDGEKLVSIWTTVQAGHTILGDPAEQLFWVQDVAMMTQSLIRTAVRHNIELYTQREPGPL
ncbi:MAG TPA: hypothetical protein VIG66_02620 [Noviherbaspirillum sp.]